MARADTFLLLGLAVVLCSLSVQAQTNSGSSINGRVGKPGIEGATVFLCDAESGLPLDQKTHQQVTWTTFGDFLCARTDTAGCFGFTNIPPGSYRLVAQSFHEAEPAAQQQLPQLESVPPSDRVDLHGTSENFQVPSPAASNVLLLPFGTGAMTFKQNFPNSSGYLLLSTKPVGGDAILGFLAWNTDFLTHLIGVGCHHAGRTLVITGLPERDVQAVIFANDSSPGFGATFYATLPGTTQTMPIVASWGDGQHEPPARIRHIMDVLETNHLTANKLLHLEQLRADKHPDYLASFAQALGPLERVLTLPNGEKASVADVYACARYRDILDFTDASKRDRAP